ncbi:MAG: hypothetical protein JXQ75_09795 [Phycisphaerae bacterium]|nr:hypothetical protein [Phycisphaerae bacterium]
MMTSVAMLAVCVLVGGGTSSQDWGVTSSQLPDANPTWLRGWRVSMDRQMELLTAAYELDFDTQQNLREELLERLRLQESFEEEQDAILDDRVERMEAAGGGPDSPEAKAASDQLTYIYENMPLNEDRVVGWLEERLPPEVVAVGRPRLEELRYRGSQRLAVDEDDSGRRASRKSNMAKSRRARSTSASPDVKPVPHGHKAEAVRERARQQSERRVVEPNRGVSKPSEKPKDQAKPSSKPKLADFATAPPLDEWDRYVARTAEKYLFTDPQLIKAHAILRDLRRRAYQYRMSRSADFAKAELILDARARKERLDQLDYPLNALFDELKLRLENLPTLAQKQRADKPRNGKT